MIPGYDGRTWPVLINDTPQYVLTPVPAAGQFTCQVVQTINGKRLDKGKTHATAEEAIKGGLEELRETLGW